MSLSVPGAAVPNLEPSAAEAPHTLPRYVEPVPFVTARSVKSFTAAAVVACGCAAVLYRILAKSVAEGDILQDEAARALIPVAPSTTSALLSKPNVGPISTVTLPTFQSPTSFLQLSTLAASDELRVSAVRPDVAVKPQPLLHQEAWGRVRASWNETIDFLEAAAVEMEIQRREYVEAAAKKAIHSRLAELYPNASFEIRPVS